MVPRIELASILFNLLYFLNIWLFESVSCEGSLLASGSADCSVKLWDVTRSTKLPRSEEKYVKIHYVALYIIIWTSNGKQVKISKWNVFSIHAFLENIDEIPVSFSKTIVKNCCYPSVNISLMYVWYLKTGRSGSTSRLRSLKTLPTKSTPVYTLQVITNLP